MTAQHTVDARAGDQIEARSIRGEPPRRGEVIEILGQPGHERFLVRWNDGHESIVFPADGVTIVRPPRTN